MSLANNAISDQNMRKKDQLSNISMFMSFVPHLSIFIQLIKGAICKHSWFSSLIHNSSKTDASGSLDGSATIQMRQLLSRLETQGFSFFDEFFW